ncbi:hypothetical protein [Vibrio vulnificus]|uniref:hypothetical protein n=1 Tax=Vibrio vulnificus TaxID=672 RepID=UPI0018656FD3|nr:hypothetical protein [Vibrio vulnificus]EGR7943221.1 hypothetical protein [Vibrio vulnificus]
MDYIKEVLETVYYLSGVVLVLIAYLALGQIKVAKQHLEEQKKALKITSKRDALKLTSEQIGHYGNFIVPLQTELDIKIDEHKIKFFSESDVTYGDGTIKVAPYTDEKDMAKLLLIVKEFTKVMNSMEGFAVYFVSGVAEEKVAYHSLSSTYCAMMKKLMPMLVIVDAGNKRFSASMQLFHIWNSRLIAEDLALERDKINEQLKEHRSFSVDSIGTT